GFCKTALALTTVQISRESVSDARRSVFCAPMSIRPSASTGSTGVSFTPCIFALAKTAGAARVSATFAMPADSRGLLKKASPAQIRLLTDSAVRRLARVLFMRGDLQVWRRNPARTCLIDWMPAPLATKGTAISDHHAAVSTRLLMGDQ